MKKTQKTDEVVSDEPNSGSKRDTKIDYTRTSSCITVYTPFTRKREKV